MEKGPLSLCHYQSEMAIPQATAADYWGLIFLFACASEV